MKAIKKIKQVQATAQEAKLSLSQIHEYRITCLRQHSRNLRLKVNNKLKSYGTHHMIEELLNFENGL